MPQPFDSKEFSDHFNWEQKSKKHKLETFECISTWTDICGFGNLLQKNNWDLIKLQEAGFVELLNEVYNIASRNFLPDVSPFPSDKVLVLNDGVAKTVDLKFKENLNGYRFLFFLRDSIINHYFLLDITQRYDLGIRTIFAGGSRIQYSPEKRTGHSILSYDENNISDFGKRLLNTNFLYNPSEFQMNTAFAKAFTIDSLGTKENIYVNGLYVESSFFDIVNEIPDLKIIQENDCINIYHRGNLMFSLSVLDSSVKNIKGLNVKIYHIDRFLIYKQFDGDDLEFLLYREYINSY